MRNNRASITAMGVAMLRALESERPFAERICNDPLARCFAPVPFPLAKWLVRCGLGTMRGMGVLEYVAARTHCIDECLLGCVAEETTQLVILGAGFDSRPYRLEHLLKDRVTVFEVDHPATQRQKQKKLASLQRIPANVRFVPIDFTQEGLEKLTECGLSQKEKTLFIWEGVTCYLTEEAIAQTLAFIGKHPPGSTVIFDYLIDSALQGKQPSMARQFRRYAGLLGEELRFGLHEGMLPAFLEARGFQVVQELGTEELKRLYLQGSNGGRKMANGMGIAIAQVGNT